MILPRARRPPWGPQAEEIGRLERLSYRLELHFLVQPTLLNTTQFLYRFLIDILSTNDSQSDTKFIQNRFRSALNIRQCEPLIFATPPMRNAHFCFSRRTQNPSNFVFEAYKKVLRKVYRKKMLRGCQKPSQEGAKTLQNGPDFSDTHWPEATWLPQGYQFSIRGAQSSLKGLQERSQEALVL